MAPPLPAPPGPRGSNAREADGHPASYPSSAVARLGLGGFGRRGLARRAVVGQEVRRRRRGGRSPGRGVGSRCPARWRLAPAWACLGCRGRLTRWRLLASGAGCYPAEGDLGPAGDWEDNRRWSRDVDGWTGKRTTTTGAARPLRGVIDTTTRADHDLVRVPSREPPR
jgi:hypothetical protein